MLDWRLKFKKDSVVIQKVCSPKTSNFQPAPPCSSLLILHAGCLWIFLNEKLWSEKREKNYLFCKLNIKDGNVFYTYIYNNNNKNIYMFIYKKSLTKCLCRFNKTFSNCRCLKNQAIFLQSEHRDRLNPSPPPVRFHSLFKDLPLLLTTNPLLKRVRWKRWREFMIMLVHSRI